jgi:transposase
VARPTKLTKQVQRRLVGLTRAGIFIKESAPFAGVTRPTVYSWMRRGEAELARVGSGRPPNEAEQPYAEFARAMNQAKAYANVMDMMVIRRAAATDPNWALRSLKLRNPEWF